LSATASVLDSFLAAVSFTIPYTLVADPRTYALFTYPRERKEML